MTITLSEYLNESIKESQMRNLLETDINNLAYFPEFGVDRDLMLGKYQIDKQSTESYIRQRETTFKMDIKSTTTESNNFMFNMEINI